MHITTRQPAMSLHELIQKHPLLQDVECGVALPPGWVEIVHQRGLVHDPLLRA
jgi:hypothetical protein